MNILDILGKTGALHKESHFVYTGGTHGDAYVNLRVLNTPANEQILQQLSCELFKRIIKSADINTNEKIVVVGPTTLGAVMAEMIAEHCNQNHMTNVFHSAFLKTVIDEREQFVWQDGGGIDLIKEAQVIWMDDLMNAGSTFKNTRHLIETFGEISAIATIADRSGLSAEDLQVPHFESLVQFTLNRYPESGCPHCASKVPIVTSLGHGGTFQKSHPDYKGGFVEI